MSKWQKTSKTNLPKLHKVVLLYPNEDEWDYEMDGPVMVYIGKLIKSYDQVENEGGDMEDVGDLVPKWAVWENGDDGPDGWSIFNYSLIDFSHWKSLQINPPKGTAKTFKGVNRAELMDLED